MLCSRVTYRAGVPRLKCYIRPMLWAEVERRIAAGEGAATEFKRALEFRRVGRAICGFANSGGGVLVLGVADDGGIVGLPGDPQSIQERLANFMHNGCNAPLRGGCGCQETPQGWVHWVEVPGHRGFEPMRFDGRVWVRRGRTSVEPSPMELQDLYNAFGYILTEEQTVIAAGIGDLDIETFRRHMVRQGLDLDDPQPALEDDLRNLGAVAEFDGALHPTLFGLLAFGKQPQTFPQTGSFWVDCVAYAGGDQAADMVRTARAAGRLAEQVDSALGFARGFGQRERVEDGRRRDEPLLPVDAIREAVVNAVVHRDYAILGSKVLLEVFEDRVCITSPGSLPNHLSVAAVLRGGRTRSRNEMMANHMLDHGFMEKRGRGFMVMREAMRQFNGLPPLLEEDAESRFVTVTLPLLAA